MTKEAINILLREWSPHKGQKEVLRNFFKSDIDMLYVECGRKWGKSEFGVFLCWLMALSKPNSEIYYLCPLDEQAKEIVWACNRMQTANTQSMDMVRRIEKELGGEIVYKNSELRVIFPNGSFIKCDGSNNYESHRGYKPDLVICDEYLNFREEWFEVFRPNMAPKQAKTLFITTPPEFPNHATELADMIEKGDVEGGFYMTQTSYENDQIPGHVAWLDKERRRLKKLGKEDQFRLEYLAERVNLTDGALVPHLSSQILEDTNAFFMSDAGKVCTDFELFCVCTDANAQSFRVLCALHNKNTGRLLVHNISQANKKLTNASEVASVIQKYIESLFKEYEILTQEPSDIKCTVVTSESHKIFPDVLLQYDLETVLIPERETKITSGLDTLRQVTSEGKIGLNEECIELLHENSKTGSKQFKSSMRPEDIPLMTGLKMLMCLLPYNSSTVERKTQKTEDEQYMDNLETLGKGKTRFDDYMQGLMWQKYGTFYNF